MSIVLETWRTKRITLSATVEQSFKLETIMYKNQPVIPNVIQVRNFNNSDVAYMDNKTGVGSTQFILSINPQNVSVHVVTGNYDTYYFVSASNCYIDVNYAYDPEPIVSDLDQTQTTNIINTSLTVGNVGITSIASGDNNIGNVDLASSIPAGDNNIGNVDLASSIPAGDNNIGNVDLASSIPAGTNLVGKIEVVDTANKLKVESDGSINVNGATFSGTIGTVKLEDSTGTYYLNIDSSGYITSKLSGSIPAGDNNIGNVDLASSIPAGDNNIGNVDIVTIASGQNIKPSTSPVIYNSSSLTADSESSQALPSNCKKFVIGLRSKDDTVTWQLKFGTGGTAFYFNGSETYEVDNLLLSSQTLYFQADKSGEYIQIIAYS